MKKKKHKQGNLILKDLQRQKTTARKLGYENTEQYVQGLKMISRLLAMKRKEESK